MREKKNIVLATKSLYTDFSTASYNPKNKKISSMYSEKNNDVFHKLIFLHERGHKYLDDKGFNNITFIIIKIWLLLTVIYPLIYVTEEIICWLYAFIFIKQKIKKR
jgi:hypothetical protein